MLLKEVQLSDDTTVTVKIDDTNTAVRVIFVKNGKYVGGGTFTDLTHSPSTNNPDILGRVGDIFIRKPHVFELIKNAVKEVQTAFDGTDNGRFIKLSNDRQKLVDKIGAILAMRHDEHVANIERLSATGVGISSGIDHESREIIARQELADFDAQYPDIIAKIKASKKTATDTYNQ